MSNQPENEQTEIMTPEEVRQYVLAEIDATKQAIAELSEEELEEVAGGAFAFSSLPSLSRVVDHFSTYGPHYMNAAQTAHGLYQTYKVRRPQPPAPGR
jgi:hypothetical protein